MWTVSAVYASCTAATSASHVCVQLLLISLQCRHTLPLCFCCSDCTMPMPQMTTCTGLYKTGQTMQAPPPTRMHTSHMRCIPGSSAMLTTPTTLPPLRAALSPMMPSSSGSWRSVQPQPALPCASHFPLRVSQAFPPSQATSSHLSVHACCQEPMHRAAAQRCKYYLHTHTYLVSRHAVGAHLSNFHCCYGHLWSCCPAFKHQAVVYQSRLMSFVSCSLRTRPSSCNCCVLHCFLCGMSLIKSILSVKNALLTACVCYIDHHACCFMPTQVMPLNKKLYNQDITSCWFWHKRLRTQSLSCHTPPDCPLCQPHAHEETCST